MTSEKKIQSIIDRAEAGDLAPENELRHMGGPRYDEHMVKLIESAGKSTKDQTASFTVKKGVLAGILQDAGRIPDDEADALRYASKGTGGLTVNHEHLGLFRSAVKYGKRLHRSRFKKF